MIVGVLMVEKTLEEGIKKILLKYYNKRVFSYSACAFFKKETDSSKEGVVYCGRDLDFKDGSRAHLRCSLTN